MGPVEPALERAVRAAWASTASLLQQAGDAHPPEYYELVALGHLRLGVGSALVPKFLLRLRGPSADPDDDVIVEIKQHGSEARTACVFHPPNGGVLYPQVAQLRLGRLRPEVLAFVPHVEEGRDASLDDWMCWVRSWDPGYQEIDVEDLEGDDLLEVARDVGHQLGRGHALLVTAPLERQHRIAQHQSARALRPRIVVAARELAEEVRAAWRADREALLSPPSSARARAR